MMALRIRAIDHKCTSSDGEWDGTWDTSYEWVIERDGEEIAGMDGYRTYDQARDAGEMAFARMER